MGYHTTTSHVVGAAAFDDLDMAVSRKGSLLQQKIIRRSASC